MIQQHKEYVILKLISVAIFKYLIWEYVSHVLKPK
jgi:hypothetical protein